jgi:hypothetical protein
MRVHLHRAANVGNPIQKGKSEEILPTQQYIYSNRNAMSV